MRFLLLLALMWRTLAIDMDCQESQECPNNAYCLPNEMCACNSGYIGDCSTSAYFLSSSSISATLNFNTTTFFYVNPQAQDTFIEFTFEICLNQPSSVMVTLTLWGQTGDITTYNQGNALGNPTSATLSGCQQFITPYISFGQQPNGQNQMLVLGITDNSVSASITIGTTQQQISGFFVYYYILIAIVVIVVIVIIIGVSVFMIRKRRRNLAQGIVPAAPVPAYKNIEHFQNFMPTFLAQNLGPEKVVCSICLQQIELNQTVRRTPCNHIFHSTCIDSWCIKNLTCPVCRTDLTLESMAEASRSSACYSSINDRVQFQEQTSVVPEHLEEISPSVEAQSQSIEATRNIDFDQGKYQIREHML